MSRQVSRRKTMCASKSVGALFALYALATLLVGEVEARGRHRGGRRASNFRGNSGRNRGGRARSYASSSGSKGRSSYGRSSYGRSSYGSYSYGRRSNSGRRSRGPGWGSATAPVTEKEQKENPGWHALSEAELLTYARASSLLRLKAVGKSMALAHKSGSGGSLSVGIDQLKIDSTRCIYTSTLTVSTLEKVARELFEDNKFKFKTPNCHMGKVQYSRMKTYACVVFVDEYFSFLYQTATTMQSLGATKEEAFAPIFHFQALVANLKACYGKKKQNQGPTVGVPHSYHGLYEIYNSRLLARLGRDEEVFNSARYVQPSFEFLREKESILREKLLSNGSIQSPDQLLHFLPSKKDIHAAFMQSVAKDALHRERGASLPLVDRDAGGIGTSSRVYMSQERCDFNVTRGHYRFRLFADAENEYQHWYVL